MGTCIFLYFYLELFFKGDHYSHKNGHDHQSIFSIDIKSLKQPIDYIEIRKLTILFFKKLLPPNSSLNLIPFRGIQPRIPTKYYL